MKLSDKFLNNDSFSPKVDYNHDLDFLGDESSFAFGVEVSKVEAAKKFPQIYKFHIGDTGPKTPEPIIEVAVQALKDKQTKYAHFMGFPQVRENIAKFWTTTRGLEIKKENILLEPGGKPAIELALQALVNKDDEIIVQNPSYPIYASLASFYTHKKPLEWTAHQNPDDKTLEFNVADLEKILVENKNIKLLFLNTPQNPTGMMMGEDKLRQVAALAQKYRFMVVFDDIYDQITFDGRKHFSILSVPGMLDFTINLNGCSKNYAMTGWRLGFIVAPEWLIEIFGQLAVNKWSCVSRVYQIVAGTIFGDVDIDGFHYPSVREKIQPILQADLAEYEKKGKFVSEALDLLSPFIIPNKPEGAFYLFPNIENILALKYVSDVLKIKNDKDFSRWLLQEKGIAMIPGSDFGSGGQGYLRLSYAEDREQHIIPGIKYLLATILELIEKSETNALLSATQLEANINRLAKKYFE